MERITSHIINNFFEKLSDTWEKPAEIYLLGGSALCMLGSPRETLDVDYTVDPTTDDQILLDDKIHQIASDLKIDIESVPLQEFIPLPAGAPSRRIFIGNHGKIRVYVFDPYSIALSKIARGFDDDLEDVRYMLKQGLIKIADLELFFRSILPEAGKYDIDRHEFLTYFQQIKGKA
jgi:hypothetical protein